MTTKIKGTEGVEFPDASVQGTAADAGPAFRIKNLNETAYYPQTVTPWAGGYAKDFDTNNAFNTSTGRFQPLVAGYYQILIGVILGSSPGTSLSAQIMKNGTENMGTQVFEWPAPDRAYCGINNQALVYLNGSTDYLTFGFAATNAAATPVQVTDGGFSISGFLARRAAP